MSRVWDVPVNDSTRVRDVRVAAETASGHAGLPPHRTAVAALVATELATNLVKHADGGHIVINLVDRLPADADRTSVQIASLDHGPGIPHIDVALRDGYTTTATSLGAGLGTCLRLSNDFDLHSTPGRGTVAVARIDHEPAVRQAVRHPPEPEARAGGITVSFVQAEESGDAWTWASADRRVTLMLADGLGHGREAAHASTAAVRELRRTAHLAPAAILRHLHDALRSTRGAAVATAQLETDTGQLRFAGVGNVGARLHTADGWQPLVSHPGIVGAAFPATVPVQQVPWRRDSLLVMHSDGLPGRWTPPNDTSLLNRAPAVVAAAVLRDASSAARPARDDTSVAVLSPQHWTPAHDRHL
ncbi:ATP-binding SpoIIE family protein phosphatase [Streptomyces sp. NPDC000070]|uniref:ATP-binding SpoIIE family protein phosphatase n=1 Tax=Streptomyces sp. NPDC000070 TaxID=3154240 RepID=UPI00332E3D55